MEVASIFNKSQLFEIYSLSEEIALSYFNRIHNDVKRMHHACITQRNKGATLRETRKLLVATILADVKRNSSYCSSFSFKFYHNVGGRSQQDPKEKFTSFQCYS